MLTAACSHLCVRQQGAECVGGMWDTEQSLTASLLASSGPCDNEQLQLAASLLVSCHPHQAVCMTQGAKSADGTWDMEDALTASFLATEEEVRNLKLDTTASGTTASLVVIQVPWHMLWGSGEKLAAATAAGSLLL